MLLPSLIAVVLLLAPISYVTWRKLSVVEQDIVFEIPQRGVAAFNVIIKEDAIRRLRIVYDDGQVCEVFPATAQNTLRAAEAPGVRRDAVHAQKNRCDGSRCETVGS